MLVLRLRYHSPLSRLSAPITTSLLLVAEQVHCCEKPVWGDNPAETFLIFCGLVCRLGCVWWLVQDQLWASSKARGKARTARKEGLQAVVDLHLLEQCHFGQMTEEGPKIQLKAWGRVQEVNISPPLLIVNVMVRRLKGLHLKANILQAEASGSNL